MQYMSESLDAANTQRKLHPQGSSTGVLHKGPPQGSLGNPRKPWIFGYFPNFVWYFLTFLSNNKVFGRNNVIFELLQQK